MVEDQFHTAVGGKSGVVGELVEEFQRGSGVVHDERLEEEFVSSTIDKGDKSLALDVSVGKSVSWSEMAMNQYSKNN